jgi:hypothetical protein
MTSPADASMIPRPGNPCDSTNSVWDPGRGPQPAAFEPTPTLRRRALRALARHDGRARAGGRTESRSGQVEYQTLGWLITNGYACHVGNRFGLTDLGRQEKDQ